MLLDISAQKIIPKLFQQSIREEIHDRTSLCKNRKGFARIIVDLGMSTFRTRADIYAKFPGFTV
jgi:hypothetical protein